MAYASLPTTSTIGYTAIDHDTRLGSLKTLASTKYFTAHPSTGVDGHEEVLLRTGEQPVDGAFVLRNRTPDEAIVPMIEALDVKHLPRFDTVHLPELCRQNDLAVAPSSEGEGVHAIQELATRRASADNDPYVKGFD